MLSFLPEVVKGVISFILTLANSLFWIIWIAPLGVVKFCLPFKPVRNVCNAGLNWFAGSWANTNKFNMALMHKITWKVDVPDDLSMDKWYLVIGNHQSWADVLAYQYALNDVIPYVRFFLKTELKWVPILNISWWALDYPYMTRYSKEFLEKNPHMKGKDMETTKKSCEKFKDSPTAIMNFVEGTRFRADKHEKQQSPYKHLLRPSAGGIAFVLGAMGEQLDSLLDVTICYPKGAMEIWDFMCGRVPEVSVNVRHIPITDEVLGDYFNDDEFKVKFQNWLNNVWTEKDQLMEDMIRAND